jgi:hypothetical protein
MDIQVFSPEEVIALVRAADSDQDGAIFLTAAFTACVAASWPSGRRGEQIVPAGGRRGTSRCRSGQLKLRHGITREIAWGEAFAAVQDLG